jgi:hypothetical protein
MTKRSYLTMPAKFLLLGSAMLGLLSPMVTAQEPAPAAPPAESAATPAATEAAAPTVEDRVADLEAYFNNVAPAHQL